MKIGQPKWKKTKNENANRLEILRNEYEQKLKKASQTKNTAEEEWTQIEADLKIEKEEHLNTCKMLREKQQHIMDLEQSTSERIAELLDQVNELKNSKGTMESRLHIAFQETKKLTNENASLKSQVEELREFESRGLKLIQTLTRRVEQLENNRNSDRPSEREEIHSHIPSSRINKNPRRITQKSELQGGRRFGREDKSLAASILKGNI